ncbi:MULTISPECIES: flavin reductase family protein [Jonquetella]|uniref:Conserved protein of DIM6/NTAB family n=1 Tax=Jonquetella anthropi DSM 22815 TaxID=885272 RepID=H0UM51_9BACT|nr:MULTISPECIES: flavin reductase family protein [Jonquetella]EHM13627.1 conserved protein of DIM6/NTAB family [Jonquetella anthropi DSM 22815]ERL24526.1 flavin reductase-like protein [Jonquetella sp. BV3C21]
MKKSVLAVLMCASLLAVPALAVERVAVNPANGKELGPRVAPSTVIAVATYDANGKADAALIDRWGIVSSSPARIGVAVNKKRATHDNIMASKFFTVNLPSEKFLAEMDFFGNHSLKKLPDLDKFAVTGVKTEKAETVNAPCLVDFPVTMECEVEEAFDGGSHTFFIAKVNKTWIDKNCIDPTSGELKPEAMKLFLYWPGTGKYYHVGDVLGTPGEALKAKFEKQE